MRETHGMTHGFETLTAGRSGRYGCPGYSRCLPVAVTLLPRFLRACWDRLSGRWPARSRWAVGGGRDRAVTGVVRRLAAAVAG